VSKEYKNGIFRLVNICGIGLLCLVLVFSLFQHSEASERGKAVAKVNGTVLTEADLAEVMNRLVPATSFHWTLTPERRAKYRPKALKLLIEEELLYQAAKERGMKVKRSKINDARKKTIERLGGKRRFKAALKRANLTDREYRKKLERQFLIEKIIKVEVEDKATVSEEEVRAYYEQNKSSYVRPEARRIRHILISVPPNATVEERQRKRQRAEEVLRKLKAGEDFAKLAWDYSDDPYRVKGGDLGLVHKGRLVPELEKTIFALRVGELSGIIETIYGYHIVKVEEVRKPEQLNFEDVSQRIRRQLKEDKRKRLKEALISELKANAKIEIY
jgi:peptidyl-prolyl cis-trans isomerase C